MHLIRQIQEMRSMPRVTINLMAEEARDNHPFYARLVDDFYRISIRRHPRWPFIHAFEFGVALCCLPPDGNAYFMAIEAAARRNYKKAMRNGFAFRRINYNDHLADIAAIRRSTPVRQGALSKEFLEAEVKPCQDPLSTTRFHDYPYYGVFKKDQLVGYAGCLVMGEVCLVEQIYGHADYLSDGVVPMLIIGMAQDIYDRFKQVRYYGYGTFFGAGSTMQRFKKKFLFLPHRVRWLKGVAGLIGQNPSPQPSPSRGEGEDLNTSMRACSAPSPLEGEGWGEGIVHVGKNTNYSQNLVPSKQYVYRLSAASAMPSRHDSSDFKLMKTPLGMIDCLSALSRELGWKGVVKAALKLLTARRLFYVVRCQNKLGHYGWVTLGRCRYYPVESQSAVIGPVETPVEFRGQGLATSGLLAVIAVLKGSGVSYFYIDTADTNYPMQRVIEKCGFSKPFSQYDRKEGELE